MGNSSRLDRARDTPNFVIETGQRSLLLKPVKKQTLRFAVLDFGNGIKKWLDKKKSLRTRVHELKSDCNRIQFGETENTKQTFYENIRYTIRNRDLSDFSKTDVVSSSTLTDQCVENNLMQNI